jgi:putative transposase
MTAKQRLDLPNALYYVELKSNGQRTLFPERSLFAEFVQLLSQLKQDTDSTVLGYCLLQGSVHLVLEAGEQGIQPTAQALEQQYTNIYNDFHDRHGSVFHKYTPCVLLEPRHYLASVIKQIHELPVQQGLVANPAIYPWSSHNGYAGSQALPWLHTARLLNQLSQQRAKKNRRYELFMQAASQNTLELAQGNHPTYRALASDDYINKLLAIDSDPHSPLIPTLEWLQEQVCAEFQLNPNSLKLWRRHRFNREIKAIIVVLAQAFGTATLAECTTALDEPAELLENGVRTLHAKRELYVYELEQRLRQRLTQQADTKPHILRLAGEAKADANEGTETLDPVALEVIPEVVPLAPSEALQSSDSTLVAQEHQAIVNSLQASA